MNIRYQLQYNYYDDNYYDYDDDYYLPSGPW
jgi:hypothetical protein